jgi:FKBP-type peptidyl-prolyl cis-trans isomerase FklB
MKKTSLIAALIGLSTLGFTAYADDQTAQPATGTQQMQTNTSDAKAKGQAFLEANKNKKGVTVLPDGLQYKIITEGKGKKPQLSDVVVVNYAGKLINGTEFDSSYKRGEPATFPVGAVIPGWVEVLQMMPVGSKWEVYIPSDLAYGEQGAPPAIGPNEALVFTIELLDAKKS